MELSFENATTFKRKKISPVSIDTEFNMNERMLHLTIGRDAK